MMLPIAPARISPNPINTPLGAFLRMKWRISQISATTMPIRKRPKSSLPPVHRSRRGDVHAEGRTFVFDEVELKPVRDEYDGLSQSHVGFHPYLEGLIEDQQQNDKECEFFSVHDACFG